MTHPPTGSRLYRERYDGDRSVTPSQPDVPCDTSLATAVQLESFLRRLQDLLRRGALRPITGSNVAAAPTDFSRLDPAGPWPDILEGEFVDEQGRRYHLFVDTYHGATGTWSCRGVDPS
jgi:hypothetical protein